MNVRFITNEIISLLKSEDTNISRKILNIFDEDICYIVCCNNVWWFERTSVYSKIPNYMHDYLIKYIKEKLGLRYLYSEVE